MVSPPQGENGLAEGEVLTKYNGNHLMGICYVPALYMDYLIQSPQPPLDVNMIISPFSG